jgi:hypothetical protein
MYGKYMIRIKKALLLVSKNRLDTILLLSNRIFTNNLSNRTLRNLNLPEKF